MTEAQETRRMIGEQVAKLPPDQRSAFNLCVDEIKAAIRRAEVVGDGVGFLAVAMVGADMECEIEHDEAAIEGTDSMSGTL